MKLSTLVARTVVASAFLTFAHNVLAAGPISPWPTPPGPTAMGPISPWPTPPGPTVQGPISPWPTPPGPTVS